MVVPDAGSPWTDLARPPLRAAALREALVTRPGSAWRELSVVASTGSTNADLAARARAGEPEGLVLVADHQTAGRGRLTRSWTFPPRSALAVSVLLRPGQAAAGPSAGPVEPAARSVEPVADRDDPAGRDEPAAGGEWTPVEPEHWSWLPLLSALALADALAEQCGVPVGVKWPNDVLIGEAGDGPAPGAAPDPDTLRKVSGILAEVVPDPSGASARAAVVVGAGINISQATAELPVPTATSLLLAGATTTDRDTVLRAYLRRLAIRYRSWRAAGGDPERAGLLDEYRQACVTLGLRVRVELPGGDVVGQAEQVDASGRLVVRADDGTLHALAAGDVVHVRRPEGEAG